MNRNLRFYSMIMALATVYATAPNTAHATAFIIDSGLTACEGFYQGMGCWGSGSCQGAWTDTLTLGCSGISNRYYGLLELSSSSVANATCSTYGSWGRVTFSCTSCPSGYTRKALTDLVDMGATAFGVDSSNGGDLIVRIVNACHNNDCQIDSDVYACVTCTSSTTTGSWVTYNSGNKSVRQAVTTTACGESTTTYNYGCAANTYYVSGSGTATTCAACPSNATCTSTAGHRNGFTCNKGYYKNGSTACAKCPNASATYTNSSHSTYASGTTSSSGSTSVESCYVSSGTYYDAKGTFTIPTCSYDSSATSDYL